jgi:hypothetical protein
VEHDIEWVICEVADDQIEEISKEVFQKESEHKKMKAPRGAGQGNINEDYFLKHKRPGWGW